ncbi:MAG: universal stress protein [Nitrospinae bacterium]|jgi:nucleotide-binding universal stress UspA family protein|nr:universal stress protein [Nitrospinota bacterium]
MAKLLVCIDGSVYADNLCTYAAWVAKRINAEIDLLHVLRRTSDYQAPTDHTGIIGLDARSELLEELTRVDEERGRLDQKKGKIILEHGANILKEAGVEKINLIHRRGSLVETIQEFENSVEMIFIGKRGEHADMNSVFLGANLEKVARAIHKPLFIVSSVVRPIKRFLIAYDGKGSVRKAIDYITSQPLSKKGLECHLLTVERAKGDIDTSEAEQKLRKSGFTVSLKAEQSQHPDQVIASYVEDNEIDLLITGAYSHSRMHSILLGSTTASLIKACKVPLLLFR